MTINITSIMGLVLRRDAKRAWTVSLDFDVDGTTAHGRPSVEDGENETIFGKMDYYGSACGTSCCGYCHVNSNSGELECKARRRVRTRNYEDGGNIVAFFHLAHGDRGNRVNSERNLFLIMAIAGNVVLYGILGSIGWGLKQFAARIREESLTILTRVCFHSLSSLTYR